MTHCVAQSRQSGIALISVLLVFALATAIAAAIASRHSRDIVKTASFISSQQAYHYALAGEQFARQLLYRDFENADPKGVDSYSDLWNRIDPFLEFDSGGLTIEIRDLQGRFNLNNLVSPEGTVNKEPYSQFQQLLKSLGVDASLAAQLLDWMDKDGKTSPGGGAEDGDYFELNYAAPNQPIADRTELRLLKSMSAEDYAKLSKYVVALPHSVGGKSIGITRYNLNTLEDELVSALFADSKTEQVSKRQQQGGYSSVEKWLGSGLLKNPGSVQAYLSAGSEFFEITVRAVFDERVSFTRSQIYRSSKDGKITLLKRQKGIE